MPGTHSTAIATCLFDLDGTLIDTSADIALAANHVLAQHGLREAPVEEVLGWVGFGVGHLLTEAFKSRGAPLTDATLPVVREVFGEAYAAHATDNTRPYPGVMEGLTTLREWGVALAVVTNKPEGLSRQTLRELAMDPFFGAIIGGDTLSERKPAAAPVLAALETLGKPLDSAVMFGDSTADAGAARAAGVPYIAVGYGYRTLSQLLAEGARGSIAAFPELLPMVRDGLPA